MTLLKRFDDGSTVDAFLKYVELEEESLIANLWVSIDRYPDLSHLWWFRPLRSFLFSVHNYLKRSAKPSAGVIFNVWWCKTPGSTLRGSRLGFPRQLSEKRMRIVRCFV